MENILVAEKLKEDAQITNNIRPSKLTDFIGQEKTREKLEIFIGSARYRNDSLEHILFYGPPGLGKTTLANIIANEMNANIKVITGPSIEKTGDLVAALTSLNEGDILFIDEIHRLNKNIEEILYPAMEDFFVDINIKKEADTKTIRIALPKFTLIGATTKAGSLTKPLRDRFGILCPLEYYSNEEIAQILERSSKIMNLDIEDNCTTFLAKMCRATPRIANRLLRRVRDYAIVKNKGKINLDTIKNCITLLDINENGLDKADMEILKALKSSFNGKPVGLETLAHIIGEDAQTIEDMYEPYLLKQGYISRTPRGRIVTEKGIELIENE